MVKTMLACFTTQTVDTTTQDKSILHPAENKVLHIFVIFLLFDSIDLNCCTIRYDR